MDENFVIGWYNSGNCGDESYKISFPLLFPNKNLSFVNNCPTKIKNLILGGGNVANKHFLNKITKVKCSNKIFFSGSVNGEISVDEMTNTFAQIFVRDYASIKYLNNQNVHYCPDAAFILQPDNNLFNFKKELKSVDRYKKTIVVALNSYLCVGDNRLQRDLTCLDYFLLHLARLLDSLPVTIILLPFSIGLPNDDRIINSYLLSKLKFVKKIKIIYQEINVMETLAIINQADLVISNRLHGCIFGVSCGKPTICISHHSKLSDFMSSCGLPIINFYDFSPNELKGLCHDYLEVKNYETWEKISLDKKKTLMEVSKNVHFLQ